MGYNRIKSLYYNVLITTIFDRKKQICAQVKMPDSSGTSNDTGSITLDNLYIDVLLWMG